MKHSRKLCIGTLSFFYCCLQFCIVHPVYSIEQRAPDVGTQPVYYQGVQGKPGVDFPVLTAIPKTAFNCRELETGYYADLETSCQVFHICEDGKKTSFLCPNGTIFQQSDLICDWWFKVNCTNSPLLYEESSEQLKGEQIKKKSARRHRVSENNRPIWSNSNQNVPSQNEYTKNNEDYEQKKTKNNSKQNWSSVYNEPQWNSRDTKLKEEVEYSEYTDDSSTERKEQRSRKKNGYRKVVMRKKLVGNTDRNSYQQKTEESFLTVTPASTKKFKSTTPNQKRFQNKDVQKPYSSTIRNAPQENTTPSGFYITKKKHQNEDEKFKLIQQSPNEYVNIFVGTRQKVLRTNNQRLSYNYNKISVKSQQENAKIEPNDEKKRSSTRYLDGNSNTLSEDSDETQVPQETASIVGNRYNYKGRGENTKGYYENHKSEYSEIRDPRFYTEKYFNNIVPVTTQYVTTQSFNNRKTFVGSSIGTPIPRNETATQYQQKKTLNIEDHNKKTFKLSAIAFNTANALNPFQNRNTESNPSDQEETLDAIQPTQELSTSAFTPETFEQNIITSPSSTAAAVNEIDQAYDVSIKPTNPSYLSESHNQSGQETGENILKHSIISINTAQAYESLFSEETKSPITPKSINENSELLPPIEVSYRTEEPFLSRKLEIPTTTETPENNNEIQTKFEEDLQEYNQENFPTERTETTSTIIPTRTPLPPQKPRPFELPTTESSFLVTRSGKSETADGFEYPFFRVSTASPFSLPDSKTRDDNGLEITEAPTTEPTNFYIKPEEVKVNDDVQKEQSSEDSRPGLVVPSSVSPLTLHTLATYFENALSNMTSEERENLDLNDDSVGMEEKLKALLSSMTRQKYEQLFKQMEENADDNTENTTVREEDESTENPEDAQKARKLTKLFSQALSEYLNDPTNFKNRLIQVRPTEPPNHNTVVSTEKELLSFSEDDSKNTLASLYNKTWNFNINKTRVNEQNNNYLGPDGDSLSIADSQSFVSQFNNLNYEDKKKVTIDNLPKNHWTSSPHATHLWRTTFAVDPFSLNKDFHATESYTTVTESPETESTEDYSDINQSSLSVEEQEEIKYELRVFPKLSSNSSMLQGILIDFMNSTSAPESERLHRILRKLNTTEDEFLDRMKKIEENPLTRRLILLLIHECEATKNEKKELIPFLNPEKESEDDSSSNVDSSTDDSSSSKDQDARALQLLNSLYNIATKFGR